MNQTNKRRVTLTESQLQNVLTRVVKRVVNEARQRPRKKLIRLTESDLKRVVEKSVKKIITEENRNKSITIGDRKEKLQEGLFNFNKKNKETQPEKKELVKVNDINQPFAGKYVGLNYNNPKYSVYNPYWLQNKEHPDWPLEKCKEYSKKLIIRDIGEEGFNHYKNQIWVPMKWTQTSTEDF